MKVTLALAFACSFAAACPAGAASSLQEKYSTVADPSATPAGFGTNAKVALLWHWSEETIRSVGVSKVVRGGKGVICVLPKVALNMDGIYPLVSVSPESSNTLAGFAGSRNQAELCPSTKYIEVDTYQSNGKSAVESNNVGFYLIVE